MVQNIERVDSHLEDELLLGQDAEVFRDIGIQLVVRTFTCARVLDVRIHLIAGIDGDVVWS